MNNFSHLFLLVFSLVSLNSCLGGLGSGISSGKSSGKPQSSSEILPGWIRQLGATTKVAGGSNDLYDSCTGLDTDAEGNIYCAGSTNGSLGEANGGSNDAFVMKLTKHGDLLWIRQLGDISKRETGSTSGDDYCKAVTVDHLGNVYCAGHTTGHLGETNASQNNDAFILKLNSNGEVQWIRQLGSVTKDLGGNNTSFEFCQGIAVDLNGNVFCGGYTTGALEEVNGGGWDAFVVKFSSDGAFQWLTHLGETTGNLKGWDTSGTEQCFGLATDTLGNIYCAGDTTGNLGEIKAGNIYNKDAFVMKLLPTGEISWIKQFGSLTKSSTGNNEEDDSCSSVATDLDNNIYCAGHTAGSMGETSAGGIDLMVMKLDSSGDLQWLTQLGSRTTYKNGTNLLHDRCLGVDVDAAGNVYCAGSTESFIAEKNGYDPNNDPFFEGPTDDAFVLKLNSSGQLQWVKQLGEISVGAGNAEGYDVCNGVAVDQSGSPICAGFTTGPIGESNAGGSDVLVMKLRPTGELN